MPEKERMIERAVASNPGSPLVLMIQAVQLRRKGLLGESENMAQKAIGRLRFADTEEQSRVVRQLMEFGPARVVEEGTKLLREDPDNLDLCQFVSSAKAYFNPKEALSMLDQALASDPTNSRLLEQKATILLQTGDITGATKVKEIMNKQSPEGPLGELIEIALAGKSADLLTTKRSREEYLSSCRAMLEKTPRFIGANLLYLQALLLNGLEEEAAERTRYIVDNVPVHQYSNVLGTASMLHDFGLTAESGMLFDVALKAAKNPLERLLTQVMRRSATEEYRSLESEISDALRSGVDNPVVRGLLGRIQSYLSDPRAEANLKLAADAGLYDSMILLASMRQKRGAHDESQRLLERVLNSSDADGLSRIRALIGLGLEQDATHQLEAQLEQNPSDLLCWLYLASMKKGQGRDAVTAIVNRMLEAGVRMPSESRDDSLARSLEMQENTRQLVDEIMSGRINEMIRRASLQKLIDTMRES
jgi:tetratricopeptide (TPR) repeat protein